jgi:DNA (cytosine-5)-methyltransferase 1
MLTVADIFSGIGGFSLGLEKTGFFETKFFCEMGTFQRRILAKHWPDTPCIENVRSIGVIEGGVDVICGGFPCQAFSSASRGRKVAENLWPELARLIDINRPKFAIAENVMQEPIQHAAADLRQYGYSVTIRNIGADDCGAPHARSRWWLCAHPDDEGEFQRALDAEVGKLQELCAGLWGAEAYRRAIRIPHGVSTGVDEPRRVALGNSVVPQIPEAIGRAIGAVWMKAYPR